MGVPGDLLVGEPAAQDGDVHGQVATDGKGALARLGGGEAGAGVRGDEDGAALGLKDHL